MGSTAIQVQLAFFWRTVHLKMLKPLEKNVFIDTLESAIQIQNLLVYTTQSNAHKNRT
jgi:hypothetical protein